MAVRDWRRLPEPGTIRGIALAMAGVGLIVVAGTGANMWALHESVDEAAYRTVNIVTTAGAVSPPTNTAGRIIAMVLLGFGVAGFLFVVALATEAIASGTIAGTWGRKRMEARAARLVGHHIVCGYGRVGRRAARDLVRSDHAVVVIDDKPEMIELATADGHIAIRGEAADEDVLRQAGVERAQTLVACCDDDAVNTFIVLTARGMRSDLRIVARAAADSAAGKLARAGADQVVSPYATAGEQIANMLARPRVAALLALAADDGREFVLEELKVPEGIDPAGRSIGEMNVRSRTGATILAVVRAGHKTPRRPRPSDRIHPGDLLVAAGTGDEMRALEALLAELAG